jgi:hypothetical protein
VESDESWRWTSYQRAPAEVGQKGRTTPLRCTNEPTVDCAPSCTSDAISSCPSPLMLVPNSSSRPDLADDAPSDFNRSRNTSTIGQLFSAIHLVYETSSVYLFLQELHVFDAESLVHAHLKITLVNHKPGVLERRSREPKTSCGGAAMMVECRDQRDGIGSRICPVIYRRKADCCNLYATKLPFFGPPVFNLSSLAFLGSNHRNLSHEWPGRDP